MLRVSGPRDRAVFIAILNRKTEAGARFCDVRYRTFHFARDANELLAAEDFRVPQKCVMNCEN